ncbi:MAG: two-component regulator propeller domain-containing protein, partial [Thermoanaerobaculia bacterium]
MLVRPFPPGRPLRCAVTLSVATVLGLPATAERLLVRTYTVADGLASDRVMSVATDRDGFLWVCTDGGLSRFDGSAFVSFRTRSGLPHPLVNHFLQTRAGTRWVATNGGGVARLN